MDGWMDGWENGMGEKVMGWTDRFVRYPGVDCWYINFWAGLCVSFGLQLCCIYLKLWRWMGKREEE